MTANDIRSRQSAGLPNDLRSIVAAWHRARNIDDVPTAESLRGEMLQAVLGDRVSQTCPASPAGRAIMLDG